MHLYFQKFQGVTPRTPNTGEGLSPLPRLLPLHERPPFHCSELPRPLSRSDGRRTKEYRNRNVDDFIVRLLGLASVERTFRNSTTVLCGAGYLCCYVDASDVKCTGNQSRRTSGCCRSVVLCLGPVKPHHNYDKTCQKSCETCTAVAAIISRPYHCKL